jgi:hypothetical protein
MGLRFMPILLRGLDQDSLKARSAFFSGSTLIPLIIVGRRWLERLDAKVRHSDSAEAWPPAPTSGQLSDEAYHRVPKAQDFVVAASHHKRRSHRNAITCIEFCAATESISAIR